LPQSQLKIDLADIKQELSTLRSQYTELSEMNQRLSSRLHQLEILLEVNNLLSNSLDQEETIDSIRRFFRSRSDLDEFALMIAESEKHNLQIVATFGFDNNEAKKFIDVNTQPFAQVVREKKALYFERVDNAKNLTSHLGHSPRSSVLLLPILFQIENEIGLLSLGRRKTNGFSADDIEFYSLIANHISSILEKTFLYHHAQELAYTDGLTGIFNRRYFDQRLQREVLRARRYDRCLSVLMVDIDHFKKYNDSLGHLMGDEVLRKVAKILEENLRRADVVCRYGGEEFVVILPEIDLEHATYVAEKLRQTVLNISFP